MANPASPNRRDCDHDGVLTLWHSFLNGYSLAGGSSNCIGTRLPWDYSSPQPIPPRPEYQWLSYAQVLAKIRDLSAGLIQLFSPSCDSPSVLSPQNVLHRPRLALWCPSSPSWTISEYAAYRNSVTVVSINDHLSAQAASEIIQNTHPYAIVLSTHNFHRLIRYLAHQTSRNYQITTSPIAYCDLESNLEHSLRLDNESHSSKGTRHEPIEINGLESGSPTTRRRDDHSHAAQDSNGLPSTPSSPAPQGSRHMQRSSEPIYILTDPLQLSSHARLDALQLGLSFYSLEEVARIGHAQNLTPLPIDTADPKLESDKVIHAEEMNPLRPESRTLAGIVYSSGTTGNPKPCVLTHANFAANLAAFNYLVKQNRLRDLHTQDLVHFSYLPLHHIYEKQTQAWVLHQGGSIGFSTLESPRFLEDLTVLKPTFLSTTPSFLTHQILDRRLQFLNNFNSFKSPIESYLLNKAIDQKLKMLKAGFGEQIWLWDRFVLGYLRDQLGGRLQWIVSGTSPLSKHVAELLSVSLSVKISEGYGMTETCGAACITLEDGPHDFEAGHVGPPLPCCEIKWN